MDASTINLPSAGRRRGRYSDAFKAEIGVPINTCMRPHSEPKECRGNSGRFNVIGNTFRYASCYNRKI